MTGPRIGGLCSGVGGLERGWVTDILPRNPALKALGNGVVPQQCALAVRTLLSLDVGGVAA